MAIRYLSGVNIDSNTLFVDDVNNRVGVGTGSPAYTLDIATSSSPTVRITRNGATDLRLGASIIGAGALIGTYSNSPMSFLTNSVVQAVITEAGNVGIGTTSPGYKFEVNGTGRFNGELTVAPSSTNGLTVSRSGGYASIYGSNDLVFETDGVFYFGVYTPRLFSVNGSFYTTAGGNVGIGTASPSQKLHVVGNGLYTGNLDVGHSVSTGDAAINLGTGRTGNGFAYIDLIGDTTYTDYGLRILRNNGGANTTSLIVHRGTGDFSIQNNEAANLVFLTAATERMRITAGGNVGIGTSSPNVTLEANGKIRSTRTNVDSQYLQIDGGDPTGPYIIAAGVAKVLSIENRSTVNSEIWFNNAVASNYIWHQVGSEVMRITAGGNVGIGTTAPTYKLDVNGNARAGGMTLNAFATGTSGGNLELGFDGTHGVVQAYNRTTGWIPLYLSGDDIRFNPQGTERMRITSGGNVGIGTTAPGFKLDVSGTFHSGGDATFNGTNTYINSSYIYVGNNTADLVSISGNTMYFPGNGNVGIGTTAPNAKINVFGTNGNGSTTITQDLLHVGGNELGGVGGYAGIRLAGTSSSSYGVYIRGVKTMAYGYYWNDALTFSVTRTNTETTIDEVMRITSDGNVGIGTTSPDKKLVVVGDGTGTAKIGIAGFSGNYTGISLNGTLSEGNYNILSSPTDPTLYINRPTGSGIQFRENNTSQMVIAVGGNVGIGTTAPSKKLHVYNSGPNQGLRASNADGVNMDVLSGANGGIVGTYSNHPLSVYTNSTEKVTISASGNVGINTTNPTAKLHVNGAVRIDDTGTVPAQQNGTPVTCFGAGNPDFYMGEPEVWLKINIAGTDYVIPAYLQG